MHTSIHYMTFLNNKYTKTYYQIINRARSRTVSGYTETHHIIPRSLNGDNSPENLVVLTAREHFICHRLLLNMTTGNHQRSMSHALRMMTVCSPDQVGNRYIPNGVIYENIKIKTNAASKGRPCSPETREKIRQANLNKPPPSADTRAKLSAAAKRRKGYTAEGLKSIQESNRNRVWTEESKQKLRDFNTGKTNVSQKGIPQEKLTCPHCQLTGGKSAMKHWHFDRCRDREHEQYTNVIS